MGPPKRPSQAPSLRPPTRRPQGNEPPTDRSIGRWAWLALAVALAASGCAAGQPILAQAPAAHPTPPPTAAPTARPSDPQPIVFPRDDGPHDRLTEWWYDTGHLTTADGRHFGFEFVIFRAERGGFPVSWASHLALTDEAAGTFRYDQRTAVGPQVDRSPPGGGFDLSIAAPEAAGGEPGGGASAWTMAGLGGRDTLSATSSSAGFGLHLTLDPQGRPPVLQGVGGWVDFGPAGGSYYYSRPRLSVGGTLDLGGVALAVTGLAWFDHQWGDFIALGGGGWDWFAVDLDDGSAVTLSLVRAADGSYPLVYGTYVRPDGSALHLGPEAFTVTALGTWTSPHTGARYPSGWRLAIPGQGLTITLEPTVADQELDTRPSTGVVYWEGSQRVAATRDGAPLGGEAYVELTGYGPGLAAPGLASPAGPSR